MTSVRYLSAENLITIAVRLGNHEIRDVGLLDSAASRTRSIVYGFESYPTLHLKAAALVESIIRNRPLVDGNKRLGWAAVGIFCEMNDLSITISNDEAYEFTIAVAAGKLHFPEIAAQLEQWV